MEAAAEEKEREMNSKQLRQVCCISKYGKRTKFHTLIQYLLKKMRLVLFLYFCNISSSCREYVEHVWYAFFFKIVNNSCFSTGSLFSSPAPTSTFTR